MTSKTTAVPLLILRMRSCSACALRLSENAALKAAGSRTAMTEMTSRDELSCAACITTMRSVACGTRRAQGTATHSDLETLLRILDAAGEEAHAEHEQQVTQNRPEKRRLHDLVIRAFVTSGPLPYGIRV